MAQKPLTLLASEADTLLPFLLKHISGSRNNIKSILARGQVAVDAIPTTRFDYPIQQGQTITVAAPGKVAVDFPFPILFEDKDLIVIDKPAGLLTIASDKEKNITAYHMITEVLRARTPAERVFIIHRLDRDTSGVVMFAKNEETKQLFQEKWDEILIKRGYTAVLEGIPKEESGTVHSWLHETITHVVYSGSVYDGKEAITNYRVLNQKGNYTLVDIELKTGRKNQIRVHMKDLDCPVAGDKKYGSKTDPLKRLALHASELSFRHPKTKKEIVFKAPIPVAFFRNFSSKCK
ncbi:MAG: RluA family pseudouridine synthase [Evtepia sp.]